MPLELTPLSPEELSPAVARVAGPGVAGPGRMMAAKGLAPLGPKDLVSALYQLARDADPHVAEAAQQSAERLPENILGAALREALDPRVLDYFSSLLIRRTAATLIDVVLLNRATADETVVVLAGKVGERELEIIATNQERVLRCPRIIEALYFNRKARMSTVERLLELAVRHGLILDNIPQYKEIAANILGTPPPVLDDAMPASDVPDDAPTPEAVDALFSTSLSEEREDGGAEKPESVKPKSALQIANLPVNARIRLATLGTAAHRAVLIKDPIRPVAMAAIHSPAISVQEAVKYAADRMLSDEIIREIARRKEWQKSYQLKVNLANNPKTPLAISLRYLTMLRAGDVRTIARSKSVPTAIATAARKLVTRN